MNETKAIDALLQKRNRHETALSFCKEITEHLEGGIKQVI